MAWVRSRGARRWWAPLITAISIAAAASVAEHARAEPIDRLLDAAARYTRAPAPLPARATVARRCGDDAVCAAHVIAGAVRGGASVRRVSHPDSDTIRWAHTRPSLGRRERLADGAVLIALERFGRKARREVRDALSVVTPTHAVVDLRTNPGGSFERMLEVAGLFTGPVDEALYVRGKRGRRARAIPGSRPLRGLTSLTVLVGPRTASSAEMLAALLHRYAGAELVGGRTRGKNHLVRVVPVAHDWELVLPAERIDIPGEDLAGGLHPDRAMPHLAQP